MKKIFTLIVVALAFASSAMALENVPESGLTFQGLLGMNISNIRNLNPDMNAKVGFNFGARAEYMLPKCYGVFANLGVNYTMKGARNTEDENGNDINKIWRACYVEIPIHVGYRYNFSDNFGVYADFGPYFAIGTNGKFRTKYNDDVTDNTSSRFFRNDDFKNYNDFQRFDFGLGYRIGAEYANHHSLTLGMDWGITDMYRDEYRKDYYDNYNKKLAKAKNFNCSITYGYRF